MRRILWLALFSVSALLPVHPETIRYTYDEAGRLARVEYASGKTITYSFDKAGNLVKRVVETNVPAAQLLPPLYFEAHRGQGGAGVRFVARAGTGYSALLTAEGSVLVSAGETPLRLRLLGADLKARGEGLDPLPGKSHYLKGRDPDGWVTGVAHYSRVRYRNIYPGIDLLFYYSRDGRLEHDFLVGPGADPAQIRFRVDGSHGLRLDASGDLVVTGRQASLRLKAPKIYQDTATGRREVAGGYVLDGREVRFRLGPYDSAKPLVIDPQLILTRQYGGNGQGYFSRIAADRAGDLYLLGDTTSTDLATSGAAQKYGGAFDTFVMKINRNGEVLWCTYLGGSADERSTGIAVDSAGSAYVTGYTLSTNFPVTARAIQRQKGLAQDGYVAKISPAGDRLVYSTYLGGGGSDFVASVAVDAAGNAYLTGFTGSPDFPITQGAFAARRAGDMEAFVSKLNAEGTAFLYSTFLGGSGYEEAHEIAVNSSGYAFVAGFTWSTNFPVTPGAFQTSSGGLQDAFLTVVEPNGRSLAYSTYFGGRGNDAARSVAVDETGLVYLAGTTASNNFPTLPPAPVTLPPGGQTLPFVALFLLPASLAPGAGALALPEFEPEAAIQLAATGPGAPVDAVLVASTILKALGYARSLSLGQNQAGQTSRVNVISNDQNKTIAHVLDAKSLLPIQPATELEGFLADVLVNPLWDVYVGYDQAYQPFLWANLGSAQQQPTASENQGKSGEPVATATGELLDTETDLRLGGPLPLRFARYYGSLLRANGFTSSLGTNWMHNFDQRLVLAGTQATVMLFGGRTIAFERTAAGFRPLTPHRYHYQLVAAGSEFKFLDPAEALIYTFNSAGQLVGIEDRNGNKLSVTQSAQGPTRVADGLGRSLTFAYTGGRLTAVEDQTGRRILFQHSGNDLVRATDAAGKSTEYAYATAGGMAGLLTARRAPLGNTPFTQTYDGEGRVRSQADSRGHTTTFEYHRPRPGTTTIREPLEVTYQHSHSAPDNLTQIVDATGATASLSYDAAGRRTRTTDRLGDSTTATFHEPSGYPATHTDAEGNTTTYSWASQTQGPFTYYNLTRAAYADGSSVSFTHDGAGNPLTATDQAGKQWRMSYNARGQLLTRTNPAGGATAFTYNPDGTLASLRIPSGETYTFAYDAQKRLTKITHPDGAAREFDYDSRDLLVRAVDERGNVYRFTYDDNRRLAALRDPADRQMSLAYDNDGRVTSLTDCLGNRTLLEYDQRGRLSRVANAAGNSETYQYDLLDRLTSVSDPLGLLARLTYDAEGVPTSVADGLGRTWRFRSDKLGRITESRTPLGNAYTFAYDRMGRLTSATDPLGRAARLAYDHRGLLSAIALPGEVSASYERNDLGLVSKIKDPGGSSWQRAYDAGGRLTAVADPLGRTTAVSYDQRQRISTVRTPAGDLRLEYDRAGNLVKGTYWDGTELNYQYDAHNWLIAAENLALAYDANGRISSSNGIAVARDAAGRIAAMTLAPGKTVTYSYDQAGLLTSVADWLGGVIEFRYDAARQLVEIVRPNGVVTRYGYDGDGLLASVEERREQVLASITLTRDAAGRIVSAERDLPLSPELSAGEQWLSFDSAHQVEGGAYDSLGRMVSDGARAYRWDGASRLASLATTEGTVNYAYDGLGMMVQRNERTLVQNYALGLPSISVVRQGGEDLRYYIHLPDGMLLASIEAADGARRFYHFDELGNTTLLTDDSGAVTDAYAVTPNGETVTRKGETDNPYTFQGAFGVMEEGQTGLYYMRARHYDSAAARFLTRDPLPSLHPRSINPYQYAWGDPLRYADPTGLAPSERETPNQKPLLGSFPLTETWTWVRPHLGMESHIESSRWAVERQSLQELFGQDWWLMGDFYRPPRLGRMEDELNRLDREKRRDLELRDELLAEADRLWRERHEERLRWEELRRLQRQLVHLNDMIDVRFKMLDERNLLQRMALLFHDPVKNALSSLQKEREELWRRIQELEQRLLGRSK